MYMTKIIVQDTHVTAVKNTLESTDIWKKVYNPVFNYGEFATIKKPFINRNTTE